MNRTASGALLPAALCLVSVGVGLRAQELTLVRPAGAAPGERVEVRCYGRGLKDVEGVVWLRDGVEVVALEAERDDRVRLELAVRADCELGAVPLLLRTKRGITRPKLFHIGPLPGIAGADGKNQRPDDALRIELDRTVDGRILAEETDWVEFDVKAGQAVRIEAEAVRLGYYDIDLELEVSGPDGRSIVRSDDSSIGRADPCVAFVAAADGTHRASLRDVALRGSSLAVYRLHVGTFPRPVGLLPAGGRPGERLDVALVGDVLPATATLTLPERPGLHALFPSVDGRVPPTPVRVVVDDRPNFLEGALPQEPPSAPCAFHGVIGAVGEQDRIPFAAKKGQRVELRVLARNLRSPLDPVLRVMDASGKELGANDDGLGLDGRLRFTAPADGVYSVAVADHVGRGGADFFYRVEVGDLPRDATTREAVPGRRSEDLGVAVPRGGRGATVIQVDGLDPKDGVTLGFANLPPGVRAVPVRLPAGSTVVPVVFEADPDAPSGAGLATPTATAEQEPHERPLRHEHDYPVLRVRNNETYEQRAARALPVAVTDAMPFDVAVEAPSVPILQSGAMTVPVRAARQEGCKDTITVQALWLPAGVSASTVRLTGTGSEGGMSFNASSQAAVGTWPIVLVASATIDGVVRTVATQAFALAVEAPWITAKLPRAQAEQGAGVTFPVELEHKREFEGEVTAELVRLPDGVTTKVPPITRDTATLPIELEVAASTRPGRHRSIYLRVSIATPAGVVMFAAGGNGELRVDKPLPPPSGAEAVGGDSR